LFKKYKILFTALEAFDIKWYYGM